MISISNATPVARGMIQSMPEDISQRAIDAHKKLGGKIAVRLKDSPDTTEALSLYYTPGVAAVSKKASPGRNIARDYTWIKNNVAVVSDGSAVLGLGDIGPFGALPVMEGKAMLFKHFADIDAVPIVLDVHSADEIVNAVAAIAPSFGGINLEDIAAPICFEVEERLQKLLDIPVFHDDQHGTAIVVLAGLINATKVIGKSLSSSKIVCVGAGAAGTAIIKLLHEYAHPEILVVDSAGIISPSRSDLHTEKKALLDITNPFKVAGSLEDALKDADIFIGVSKANILTKHHIKQMANQPIIFAMSNPEPEIMPDAALSAGASIVATGRSDFPNQINNALVFPGIFRGALSNNVRTISEAHKVAAAEAIARLVPNPSASEIIPKITDKRLVSSVASVIR